MHFGHSASGGSRLGVDAAVPKPTAAILIILAATIVGGSDERDYEHEDQEFGTHMDSKTVTKLEVRTEEAIATVILKMGLRQLPLLPSQHTFHLMAKAAVTVYEAAVESREGPKM